MAWFVALWCIWLGVFSLLRDLLVCGLWGVCVGATFCCFGLLVVVGCFVYLLGGFVWWVGGCWSVDCLMRIVVCFGVL